MSIGLFQIELISLQEKHIETLRQWRNDKKISQFMFFREQISKDQQLNWFQNLDAETDFYFIIEYENELIGMTHLSNYNKENRCGEVGLFIYEDAYWGTHIPVIASLALLKFCFEQTLVQEVIAKVLPNNLKAQQYNMALGFSEIENEKQTLTIENYTNVSKKWLEILSKLS